MVSRQLLFGAEASITGERDFQYLLLVATLPVLGITFVSPVLDSLIGTFGASSGTIGLMISVFMAPTIVVIPLSGVMADRYGRKVVLVVSLVLFGVAGSAIAFTTDYRIVLSLRFLQGIGYAGVTPLIITSIGDLYSDGREATGQGIRFMTAGLSGAVSPIFAGVVVVFAWQYPFLGYAITLPIAYLVYRNFTEPTATAEFTGEGRRDTLTYTRSLVRLARRREVVGVLLARALMPAVWIGFLTYNSLIVIRLLAGTPVQAGVLAAIGFGTFAFAASQAGRLSSMVEARLPTLVWANLSHGLGFVVVVFAPGFLLAALGIVLVGVGFGIIGSLYRTVITGMAPAEYRGGLVSLAEAGGKLVATLTPLVMGFVIATGSQTLGFDGSLRLAGVLMAVVGAGGAIVCLVVAASARGSFA